MREYLGGETPVFTKVDPITSKYPELTPYQFASNRPIDGVDLDGLEWKAVKSSTNKTTGYSWVGGAMVFSRGPQSTDKRSVVGVPQGTVLNAALDNGNGTITLYAYSFSQGKDNKPTFSPKTTIVNKDLTEANIQKAADDLGVDINIMKAVQEVESPQGAYDAPGRASILFERHKMYSNMDSVGMDAQAYSTAHPDLVNSTAGGYGTQSSQLGRLDRAKKLDNESAIQSASWGAFQIMGESFSLKYGSPEELEMAMNNSASEQFNYFVSYLNNNPKLITAMQKKDWVAFAKTYNGPNYKKNKYDEKLKAAFERLSGAQAHPTNGTNAQTTPISNGTQHH